MRTPHPDSAAWLDGARTSAGRAAIALGDPSWLFGVGLFETLVAAAGHAIDVDAHLERMRRGAAVMTLQWPDEPQLRANVAEAALEFGLPAGWLKIVLVAGGRTVLCGGPLDGLDRLRSVRAIVLPWTRNAEDPLVAIKSTSWAGNVMGLAEAARSGVEEGLWRNTRGHLAEGCTSNLFVIRHRRVFTPGAGEAILPGIVRALTLRAVRELGLQAHESRVRLPRLWRADEAFLTSSVFGIRPLVEVDGRPIGSGRVGPVTLALAANVARIRGLPPPRPAPLDRPAGPPDL